MENQVLFLALIKKVEEKLEEFKSMSEVKPLRGLRGPPGKDFDIEEHRETLRNLAKEFAVKFEDFTAEQVEKLRGAPGQDGRDGRDGRDGKDFSFEEHKEYFESLSKSLALKFEDYTPEQIEKLRGHKGEDGKDFSFDENYEEIKSICRDIVNSSIDTLKLHFSDLTQEDIEQLRGPRGREGKDGRDGKDFVFEEHEEFFKGLKLKFSDLTEEDIEKLKLNFSDLTDEEKDSLKLKFESLTEEQKLIMRGPRGQRGRQGDEGPQGVPGPRGFPGPKGISGINGRDGIDGEDGQDAPYVTDIKVEQSKQEIEFVFEFSDGSEIRTDPVKLPAGDIYVAGGGVSSSSSGGISAYANFASLPSGQPDGSVAVTLDTHQLYIYNEGTSTWTLSSGSSGSSGLDLVSYTQFGGF